MKKIRTIALALVLLGMPLTSRSGVTQINALRQVLTDLGIPFVEQTIDIYDAIDIRNNYKDNAVKGYTGFYTVFEFDKKTGAFVGIGAFE